MRKSLLLAVSLAAFTLIPAVSAKAGKPVSCPGGDVTSLTVTIDGSAGNSILSDGKGPYVNTSKTSLAFQVSNCTYDLVMNLGTGASNRKINVIGLPIGTTTAWDFNFDRIASVPVTDGGTAYTNWCNGGVVRSTDGKIVALNSDGNRQDNYAPCSSDGGGYFARRNVGFGLAGSYGLRFQNSPVDGSSQLANDTALIKVYHPNANTWILEPDDQAYIFSDYTTPSGDFDYSLGNGEWADLLNTPNGGTTYVYGKYKMPFKITVTKP